MSTVTLIVLQMPKGWIDPQLDSHDAAIAIPLGMTEAIADEQGGISWAIYSSAAAAQAGARKCDEHTTQVGRAEFEAGSGELVSQTVAPLAPLGVTLETLTNAQYTAAVCIGFGLATADVAGPVGADGTPGPMVPYFAGATVTTIQVQE